MSSKNILWVYPFINIFFDLFIYFNKHSIFKNYIELTLYSCAPVLRNFDCGEVVCFGYIPIGFLIPSLALVIRFSPYRYYPINLAGGQLRIADIVMVGFPIRCYVPNFRHVRNEENDGSCE